MIYGLQVEVSVGNDSGEGALQRFATAFERSGAEIADFGKWVFPKLAPVFEEAVAEQFDARGAGPVSGSWSALTPDYAKWKESRAPGMPLLELTGELKASLTNSQAPAAWREWSASEFSFGTMGLEYASSHQMGTARMAARPLFDFGPAFEQGLQAATLSGLRDAVKAGSNGALDLEGEA